MGEAYTHLKDILKRANGDPKLLPLKTLDHLTDQASTSGNNAFIAKSKFKPVEAAIHDETKRALRQHADDIADASDHPLVKEAMDKARKARIYQGEFEKYNKNDRTPFMRAYNKGSTDDPFLLQKYLRAKDPDLLNSLLYKLSPEDQKAIRTVYFSNKDLAEVMRSLKNMSISKQKALLGDQYGNAQKLLQHNEIFPEGKSPGYIPKTGL